MVWLSFFIETFVQALGWLAAMAVALVLYLGSVRLWVAVDDLRRRGWKGFFQ